MFKCYTDDYNHIDRSKESKKSDEKCPFLFSLPVNLHNMHHGKLGFARRRSDNCSDNFFTICNLVEYALESRSEYIKVILSLKSDQ